MSENDISKFKFSSPFSKINHLIVNYSFFPHKLPYNLKTKEKNVFLTNKKMWPKILKYFDKY